MDLAITQSMIRVNQGPHNPNMFEKNSTFKKKESGARLSFNSAQSEDSSNSNEMQMTIKSLIQAANIKLNSFINSDSLKREGPTVVQIYLIFLKIGEIDNVKERFQADAYIEATWEDDSIEGTTYDSRIHWDPEIYLENAVGNLKTNITYKVEKVNKKTIVHEIRNVQGVFWEKLELNDFPLDTQDLSITITSAKNKEEVQFEISTEHECQINVEDFRQQQEWILYPHIRKNERLIYDVWKNYTRHAYTVSATIARRPGYFIYNAYMLIFFISVLGLVPFSFAYSSPHFRIQTTCLLILSSANFRYIVTQRLPTVSYITVLDKYMISALLYLVLLCCYHAVIGSYNLLSSISTSDKTSFDNYMLYVIGGTYVAFHLIYISYFLAKYLRYKTIGKEEEEEEKMKSGEKEKLKELNLNDLAQKQQMRPVSTSNVKPIVNPSSVRPALMKGSKNEEATGDSEIKYRNLMESPSSSLSSDINAGTPFPQKSTLEHQNNFRNKSKA